MSVFDIIIAFPGLGKSTLAKTRDDVVDIDFGSWREANGIKSWHCTDWDDDEAEAVLWDFYTDMVRPWHGKKTVLTNETDLLPLLERSDLEWVTAVVIPAPSFRADWMSGLVRRTLKCKPESFKDDHSFITNCMLHHEQWFDNWRNATLQTNAALIYSSGYSDLRTLLSDEGADLLEEYSDSVDYAKYLAREVWIAARGNAGRMYHDILSEHKNHTTRHLTDASSAHIHARTYRPPRNIRR